MKAYQVVDLEVSLSLALQTRRRCALFAPSSASASSPKQSMDRWCVSETTFLCRSLLHISGREGHVKSYCSLMLMHCDCDEMQSYEAYAWV